MKRIVEYKLKDGKTVLVEVDEPEPKGGLERAGITDWFKKKPAQVGFEEALDAVSPTVSAVYDKLNVLGPQKVEMEFGIKMSGDVSAVIASAGMEANFRVTMTWERQ